MLYRSSQIGLSDPLLLHSLHRLPVTGRVDTRTAVMLGWV